MTPRPAPLTRRATLLGLLAGATSVAGCDAGAPAPTRSPTGGSADPDPVDPHAVDPDVAALTAGLIALDRTRAGLAAAIWSTPRLRGLLQPLVIVQDRQFQVIAGALGTQANTVPSLRPDRPLGLAQARRSVTDLHDDLVRLARQAGTGPVARLLACASAGVAQGLATLPGQAPR